MVFGRLGAGFGRLGSRQTGRRRPHNTVAPVLSGTPTEGQTLSVTTGTWTGTATITYAYQWYRALVDGGGAVILDGNGNPTGTPIGGATASTYVLTSGDVGFFIFCVVTASNGVDSVAAFSNVTATTVVSANSTAYTNFIARTSGLDATHTNAYKALLNGLTTDGLFNSDGTSNYFDYLFVYATQDQATALLSLVNNTFAGTNANSFTFTADRGFTADADSSHYIGTGFNPTTAISPKYTQNSAHRSVWNLTTGDDSNRPIWNGGTGENCYPSIGGTMYFRINDNPETGGFSQASPLGLLLGNRSGANARQGYRNGTAIGAYGTEPSQAPINAEHRYLGGVTSCTRQAAASSGGGSINSTLVTAVSSRLQTYMTTVGVP